MKDFEEYLEQNYPTYSDIEEIIKLEDERLEQAWALWAEMGGFEK